MGSRGIFFTKCFCGDLAFLFYRSSGLERKSYWSAGIIAWTSLDKIIKGTCMIIVSDPLGPLIPRNSLTCRIVDLKKIEYFSKI